MQKHLIFDFETIGVNPISCPALNMSACLFDWDRFLSSAPYTFHEIIRESTTWKFNVQDQVKRYNYTYNKADLNFWADQNEIVRNVILPSKEDIKIDKFGRLFIDWIGETDVGYWWSRSNMFDPVILERLMNVSKMSNQFKFKLKFWSVRDTRTFLDAKLGFNTNTFTPLNDETKWDLMFDKHNSKHDIAADIMRMQCVVRAEAGLENE